MMVNYLFPLTDKSPAPLRLSTPESWQAERGVNMTGELGTRASPADGPGTAPTQALILWLGVSAWVLTLSQDTHFLSWSLLLQHPSSLVVDAENRRLCLQQPYLLQCIIVLSPSLSWVNSAITLPSPLTRDLIIIDQTPPPSLPPPTTNLPLNLFYCPTQLFVTSVAPSPSLLLLPRFSPCHISSNWLEKALNYFP